MFNLSAFWESRNNFNRIERCCITIQRFSTFQQFYVNFDKFEQILSRYTVIRVSFMCKYLLYRFDWHIFHASDRSWKDSISKLLGTLVLSDRLVRFKTQFHFLYSNYSLAFATLDTHSQISSAWLDGNRTTFFRPTCSNARNLISTWQRKFHDELFIIRLLTIFNSSHRFTSFDCLSTFTRIFVFS